MSGPVAADSWMDVAAYAVVGVPALVASLGALRVAKRSAAAQAEVAADVGEVKHHVVNDHGDRVMREDLDEKADKDDVARLGAQITDLTDAFDSYVKEDRAARRDLVRRIQTQERIADQHHPGDR